MIAARSVRYLVLLTVATAGMLASCGGKATNALAINASNEWTWLGGSDTVNAPGNYGTKGIPSPANVPGARYTGVSWGDGSGNLWLFGGKNDSGWLNDLWEFSLINDQWTWISGSNTTNSMGIYGTLSTAAAVNTPGARAGAIGWTDKSDNHWLFGGAGEDSSGN
jgi:hypothetical protein